MSLRFLPLAWAEYQLTELFRQFVVTSLSLVT